MIFMFSLINIIYFCMSPLFNLFVKTNGIVCFDFHIVGLYMGE